MSKKIFDTVRIPVELLFEHPRNPQEQNEYTFNELRESIAEGFDEPLLIYPRDDGEEGYWIISGNHRWMAAKAEGYIELPCIIRDDWDEVEAEIQVAKRNHLRGNLNSEKFTAYVDYIAETYSVPLDLIYERMGFETVEKFAELYKNVQEQEVSFAKEVVKSQELKLVDTLSDVVSDIFDKYGHTVPHSFIIFPLGGKKHMFIESTVTLKNTLEALATKCIQTGMDINVAIGGLLQVGMEVTKFSEISPDVDTIVEKGSVEGDADIDHVD